MLSIVVIHRSGHLYQELCSDVSSLPGQARANSNNRVQQLSSASKLLERVKRYKERQAGAAQLAAEEDALAVAPTAEAEEEEEHALALNM